MSAPITINSASSRVSSSPPSSPGLYVPVHKRADSNSSSPSSPSRTVPPTTPSYVYSRDKLFSLLPFADESMKGKMRETCPEVVMNRKTRKGLEFNGRRTELLAAKQQLLTQEPTLSAGVVHKNPTPRTTQTSTSTARVVPRRSRPVGRAPERRRNAFTSPFGARRTGDDSWRGRQAVPMSPVILL